MVKIYSQEGCCQTWGILGRWRIIDVDTNSKAYDACYCHRLYTDDTQYCYQNDITIIFK